MIPNPLHEFTKEQLEAMAKELGSTVEETDRMMDIFAAMDPEERRAFSEKAREIQQGAQEMGITADAYVEMFVRRPA
jgi:hypothetical protein